MNLVTFHEHLGTSWNVLVADIAEAQHQHSCAGRHGRHVRSGGPLLRQVPHWATVITVRDVP